jgi:hypothetical protein
MIRRTKISTEPKNSKGGAKQADRTSKNNKNKKNKFQSQAQEEAYTPEASEKPKRCWCSHQRFLKKQQWQELKTQAKVQAWQER